MAEDGLPAAPLTAPGALPGRPALSPARAAGRLSGVSGIGSGAVPGIGRRGYGFGSGFMPGGKGRLAQIGDIMRARAAAPPQALQYRIRRLYLCWPRRRAAR